MNKKFGKRTKTDFIVSKKENTIYGVWAGDESPQVIIQINYKDFMKFVKKVQERHKYFSGKKCLHKKYPHFTHLSPDVSFFFVRK